MRHHKFNSPYLRSDLWFFPPKPSNLRTILSNKLVNAVSIICINAVTTTYNSIQQDTAHKTDQVWTFKSFSLTLKDLNFLKHVNQFL